jgi:hypothetical protein
MLDLHGSENSRCPGNEQAAFLFGARLRRVVAV